MSSLPNYSSLRSKAKAAVPSSTSSSPSPPLSATKLSQSSSSSCNSTNTSGSNKRKSRCGDDTTRSTSRVIPQSTSVVRSLRYQVYDKLDGEKKDAVDKFIEHKLWLSPRHVKKLDSWASCAWEARASQKMRILYLKNHDDTIELLCCCASSEAKKRAKTWPRAGRTIAAAGYSNPKWQGQTGQGHRRGHAHSALDDA